MPSSNSQVEALNLDDIKTAEHFLSALRSGNNQKLEIGFGKLKVPCRLLDAAEEATIQGKSAQAAIRLCPDGANIKVIEAQVTMKQMLLAATTINGAPGLAVGFLDVITDVELSALFDQYVTLKNTINPHIQSLSENQIAELVENVKKKTLAPSELYTYQQAAIGLWFLETLLPVLQTANASGSAS